jgi:hypothetical protein
MTSGAPSASSKMSVLMILWGSMPSAAALAAVPPRSMYAYRCTSKGTFFARSRRSAGVEGSFLAFGMGRDLYSSYSSTTGIGVPK